MTSSDISGAGGGCLATSANDSIQPTCAPRPVMAGPASVLVDAAPRAPIARHILRHRANLSTTAFKVMQGAYKHIKWNETGAD